MSKIVNKPWGKEVWIELNENYCYKRIYINSGYKTSLQYHEKKIETNYIISGTAEVWLENNEGIIEKFIMKENDFFNVKPPKKHRVIALTDIILQEVSTPEVDDVIRIEDDNKRKNGKIDSEHNTPAVLILTSGIGSRMGNLTKTINKSLLPINNKPVISHIIEKFPSDYDFIVSVGYKSDMVKDFLLISYPNHKFTFVDVPNYEGDLSGPGYSAMMCKDYLQRPFYLTTCDCIIDNDLPMLDGNWLGVYPTTYPEKYSTVNVKNDLIIDFKDKSIDGFDLAFIGLASIWDYDIFWNELSNNINSGEIVSAFINITLYNNFKIKKLNWFDSGNLDDYLKTKKYFTDSPLSLNKTNDEITFMMGDKFIKFNPNIEIQNNRLERGKILKNNTPNSLKLNGNFLHYKWIKGKTLYSIDSFEVFKKFIDYFNDGKKIDDSIDKGNLIFEFYQKKTETRINQFNERFGEKYLNEKFSINNIQYDSIINFYNKIDFTTFLDNPFHTTFHGDLQFDNIIYDNLKFYYIDWRDSFANNTRSGDFYYDLAKLYGGCLIPYNKMKNDDNIFLIEGDSSLDYRYESSDSLYKFKEYYESWIIKNEFNLPKIKLITALIYLNMSPLHDEKFSKLLICKSIELFNDVFK